MNNKTLLLTQKFFQFDFEYPFTFLFYIHYFMSMRNSIFAIHRNAVLERHETEFITKRVEMNGSFIVIAWVFMWQLFEDNIIHKEINCW